MSLLLALGLYLVLAATTVHQVGIVGEVDLGWSMGRPPQALVQISPPVWADGLSQPTAGDAKGPLVASQVRPIERLAFGRWSLPLAVNIYTGGPPDWPAGLTYLLTGSRRLVTALHVVLGGLLIVLIHRFLRFRGTDIAAAVAVMILATDWSFLFYRKVLGGTEILLQAAALLCLWALWSRRWGGGRHGLVALGVGIGLGLMAKLTFVLTLLALFLAALLTRWDRSALRAPPLTGLRTGLAAVVLLTSPLWITALHHGLAVPVHIPSHDFPTLQLHRVLAAITGGQAPARESLHNLWLYASQPLAFFGPAYGVTDLPGPAPLRLAGLAVVAAGVIVGWRDRHPTPHAALLRFCSIFLLLQLGLLWLVARDLHHLAQATPTLAIVAGLAIDQLAGLTAPPRSPARARTALVLALPLMISGVSALIQTDAVVRQITVPTFTEGGQQQLAELLTRNAVQRVYLADYESYGMLEVVAPQVQVIHAWPAVASKGPRALADLVALAAGAHLLVLQASQPMGYNLRPSPQRLQQTTQDLGLTIRRVDALSDDRAVLYRVSSADQSSADQSSADQREATD